MRRDKNTMNPFEKLANERNNEDENNGKKSRISDDQNVEEDSDEDVSFSERHIETIVEENKQSSETPLKLPPPINTYFLFSYFPIAAVFVTFYIIATSQYSCPPAIAIPSGLIVGYTLRFILQFIFKKVFTERYVMNVLEPFITKIYGEIFSRDELMKMVTSTSINIIRDKNLRKNNIKRISRLEKDDEEFMLFGIKPKGEKTQLVLFVEDEEVPTQYDRFLNQEVRKLLVNGFHMFWNHNLNVPEEFSSVTEDGVFTGTLIFESAKDAIMYVEANEALEMNNLVFLSTRGEKFRFLESLTQIRLDAIITMRDGTKFIAPADKLMYEFQK